ncbi:neutral/alkaline ceramidase-like enzyme [Pseudonocardia cypriaca]|uniref:Neutral/alkaline ceramidase-like enzyme n=1 Tax=Pseudonocardia cypriaca TaxID=882449 RepID=A0A543GCM4_9PSEU|nr:neutral/alkaline ceramidase-like enzyme [Pseudonocardia cypriaca]
MSTVDAGTPRIGFGRTDITPPVGVELAGFGPYLRRRSTRVHGRLHAGAIAVEHGGGRWVLVSCDLLGLGRWIVDDVVARVGAATGWQPHEVAVHATHNHSGPATVENVGWGEPDPLYLAQLPALIAEAAVAAVAARAPATVAHAEVPLPGFAHNRMRERRGLTNAHALAGTWQEPEPELVDRGVHVLRVDHGGHLAGFLASYSCHPVICCEQTDAVHGDFPGEALRLVEQTRPGAVGVFAQGALGDVNPLYAHGPAEESYAALALFAGRFAGAISTGLDSAAAVPVEGVAAHRATLHPALGPFDVDELRRRRDRALATVAATPADTTSREKAMAGVVANSLGATLARLERGEDAGPPVLVQALRLGPVSLLGFGLEVFHGIKRRLQQQLGDRCLVLSTTGGWSGYAPTPDAYRPPADPYPAYEVPLIACRLPFHDRIADDLVAAGVAAHAHVTSPRP